MAINKKLIHFATKANFDTQLANSNIDNRSIIFINETGQIWTHGKFYNSALWGTNQTNYIPLTINNTTYNLSKDGHTHSYVPISGNVTMTGALNLKNGTWNNVGDDVAIGGINIAGQLGVKALNTTNPGIAFYNSSATAVGNLVSNAGTLQWNGNTIWHAGNFDPTTKANTSGTYSGLSVGYATNSDTVDSQHFSYSNTSDSPTYVWGTNASGTNFLAARANLSVNYATSSGKTTYLQNAGTGVTNVPGTGQLRYDYHINSGTAGLFPISNNANSIISFNKHDGSYDSQLGFSSDGNIYYRSFNGSAIDTTTAWKTVLHSGNIGSYALSASGGTITGSLYNAGNINLNNEVWIMGKSTGGSYYKLCGIDSANYNKFGNGSLTTVLQGNGMLFSTASTSNIVTIYDGTTTFNNAIQANYGITSSGFKKSGYDDTNVLLAGGGATARGNVLPMTYGTLSTVNSSYVSSNYLYAYQLGRIVIIQGYFVTGGSTSNGAAYFTIPSNIYPPANNTGWNGVAGDHKTGIKMYIPSDSNTVYLVWNDAGTNATYHVSWVYYTSTYNQ